MSGRVIFLIILAAFLFSASGVFAEDRLVPSEYLTIQAAIDDCNDGDVVIIAPGIYTGDGNRDIDFLGKAITVRSIDPNDPCIVATTVVNCGSTVADPHRGFVFTGGEDANSILSGFTITNAYYTGHGGGIYCDGSGPTISYCTITNCVANNPNNMYQEHGGGIYLNGSSPIITHCIITENSANGGGAIYCNNVSNPIINNCMITDNTVNSYGGGIRCWASRPMINHCTISGNSAGEGGGICYGSDCNLSANHCIIWGNNNGDFVKSTSVDVWPIVSYSDVGGGFEGTGNINSDPFFLNPASGDYHISISSPCIDAGDPNHAVVPGEVDIDRDPRVVNLRIDMGADEYTTGPSVIEITPEQFTFIAEEGGPNPPSQALYVSNVGEGQLNWTVTPECNWLSAEPNTGTATDEPNEITLIVDINNLTHGIYHCTLLVSDPCASNSPQTATITLSINIQLLVPSEYDTIQSAIDAALDGDTVLVADGVYTGPGNRDIDFKGKAIKVKSENGPESCIIDCDGTYEDNHRGFYFNSGEGQDSVLDGLTITNGYAVVMCAAGAGIYINGASPTISRCVITNNYAELEEGSLCFCLGGGIYIEEGSNTIISNCIISENSLGEFGWGAGIYCFTSENVKIRNCLINDNTALGSSSRGGGIYCDQDASISMNGCTIANNSAFEDGGGIRFVTYESPPRTIDNSILWGNLPDQIYNPNSTNVLVSYSDIQGGWAGTGNIDADPCFADADANDFHIRGDSPCRNAGDPSYTGEGETDIDGEERVSDYRVDMGADEVQGKCLSISASEYDDWVSFGEPNCWCYQRQCRGDTDGTPLGPYWVGSTDLMLFRQCYMKPQVVLPLPYGICCDLDHKPAGPYRVGPGDLAIFKTYFLKPSSLVPLCDQPPVYTGPYNFWTAPPPLLR